MSDQIDYIAVAQKYGMPTEPNSTNSYEMQMIGGLDDQAEFNTNWEEAKRLYRRYRNDNVGLQTAQRRLALFVTKAKQKGWVVDGIAV